MKKVYRILLSLVLLVGIFSVPVFAGYGSFSFNVPNWGGWTDPSPRVTKDTNDGNGVMICIYSSAWLPKYGDFTAGGTSNRISKDSYALIESTNTGNCSNWKKIYYKSGYATKGRSVSARASSSNIEPNYNSATFNWDTDNEPGC